MTPELERLVKIGAVQSKPVGELVRVTGSVQADEQKVARIGSAVSGRVTDVFVQLGDMVRVGQPLARITSPELSNAQMSYLQAQNAAQFGKRAVERAELLLSADVIGAAELQRRQMELSSHNAAVDASRSMLRSLGMSGADIERLDRTRTIDPTVAITTTRAGMVTERKLSQGQVVQPSDPVFTVADLSTVWISAEVPEPLARGLNIGDPALAVVPSLGDLQLKGDLIFVGGTVNPETRTVQVRMSVANRDRALKPAMLANMTVKNNATVGAAVPRDAVVRDADQDAVFIETAPGQMKLRPVKLGAESQGYRPVLDGIQPGDRIALDGAFHLNAVRRTGQN
jgi:cobalt-zinc-cadmium efflux system membrane fusion protein